MQTVYVDVLIFLNMIIDFLILMTLKNIFCINITYKRIVLGSGFASLFSLIALIPSINFALNILLGLISAGLSVFVTFGRCSIANYIKRVCGFFAINFLFAGFMTVVYMMFKPKGMIISNNIVYFNISPLLLIILTLICYFILYMIKRLFNKQPAAMQICNVSVMICNKKFSFKARIDTGCDLREPFSGSSVIVAEKSLFDDLKPPEENLRVIPFSSLGGEGIIKGIKAQEVIINNKKILKEIYVGFCENIFTGEIKALVSNDILGDDF